MTPLIFTRAADMPRHHGGEAGFTLVEMLVAMALLALVGLTLVRFQTFQLAGTGQLSTIALARLEADNRAVEMATLPEAPAGTMSGDSVNGGVPFRWTAQSSTLPPGTMLADLVRVEVTVTLADSEEPLATRSLLRPTRLLPEAPA